MGKKKVFFLLFRKLNNAAPPTKTSYHTTSHHTIILGILHCMCGIRYSFQSWVNVSYENIMWLKLIAKRKQQNYVLMIDRVSLFFQMCYFEWFNSMSSGLTLNGYNMLMLFFIYLFFLFHFIFRIYIILKITFGCERIK